MSRPWAFPIPFKEKCKYGSSSKKGPGPAFPDRPKHRPCHCGRLAARCRFRADAGIGNRTGHGRAVPIPAGTDRYRPETGRDRFRERGLPDAAFPLSRGPAAGGRLPENEPPEVLPGRFLHHREFPLQHFFADFLPHPGLQGPHPAGGVHDPERGGRTHRREARHQDLWHPFRPAAGLVRH